VVAGRGGDQAARPHVRRKLRHQVDPAAHLEGTHRLVVLVLDVDLGANQVVQRRVAVQRRLRQVGPDAPARGDHILQGRCL